MLDTDDFRLKIPQPVWDRIYWSFVDGGNILDLTNEQMEARLYGDDFQLSPEQLAKLKTLIAEHWQKGESDALPRE